MGNTDIVRDLPFGLSQSIHLCFEMKQELYALGVPIFLYAESYSTEFFFDVNQ
jgi:hypothetical protein